MVLYIIEKEEERINLEIQKACDKINAATNSNIDVDDIKDMISRINLTSGSIGGAVGMNSTIDELITHDKNMAHNLIICDEAHIKDYSFKSLAQGLSKIGLSASEAGRNIFKIMKITQENPIMSYYYNPFVFGDPWAPLHGIQAHFFRFEPKKWHTAAARIAPMISNRAVYFYRRCWMQAKTFMNVHFLEPEVVT